MPEAEQSIPAVLNIESFKRALDVALRGERPSGLTLEELRYFCLGVITEEDFTKGGVPKVKDFDNNGTIITRLQITEAGRQKIEAAKAILGDWPDTSSSKEGLTFYG